MPSGVAEILKQGIIYQTKCEDKPVPMDIAAASVLL
jgi:hypothetical protein